MVTAAQRSEGLKPVPCWRLAGFKELAPLVGYRGAGPRPARHTAERGGCRRGDGGVHGVAVGKGRQHEWADPLRDAGTDLRGGGPKPPTQATPTTPEFADASVHPLVREPGSCGYHRPRGQLGLARGGATLPPLVARPLRHGPRCHQAQGPRTRDSPWPPPRARLPTRAGGGPEQRGSCDHPAGGLSRRHILIDSLPDVRWDGRVEGEGGFGEAVCCFVPCDVVRRETSALLIRGKVRLDLDDMQALEVGAG